MHKFVMKWGADESQKHDHQSVMTFTKDRHGATENSEPLLKTHLRYNKIIY